MEIDAERKKELMMEKKLRACRVNIIPRVRIRKHRSLSLVQL